MPKHHRLLILATAVAMIIVFDRYQVSLAQDAAASDAEAATPQPETPAVAKEISVRDEVDDAQIENKLQDILVASEWFSEPQVAVNEGLVTLKGRTKDVAFRDKAGEWARNTEGVVAVFNKIVVEEEGITVQRAAVRVRESVASLWNGFLMQSPLIVVGLIVLVLTAFAAKIAQWIFRRTPGNKRLRVSLQDLIEQMISVGIWIVGLLIAATVVFPGMTPARLLTVLGLSGVAIGFAFKDVFENFLAGILILWKFPFDRGDYIECEGIAGKVQQITIRNTLIREVDGKLIIAPNGLLFNNPVHVYTNWKSRRITVIAGVAYGEDVDRSREVIKAAVEACQTVEHRKPIEIFAREFGESSINFEVTWWAGPTPLEERVSRDEVVAAVKRALDTAGIEIPFPYRTLTFKQPLRTIAQGEAKANLEQD